VCRGICNVEVEASTVWLRAWPRATGDDEVGLSADCLDVFPGFGQLPFDGQQVDQKNKRRSTVIFTTSEDHIPVICDILSFTMPLVSNILLGRR
jgi:hypothetical protein